MVVKRWARAVAMCAPVLSFATFGFLGCGSFDPVNYFSRNACDFLNCEVLFFIDDVLPLSAAPMGSMDMAEAGGSEGEGEQEGGHLH
ncbi:MAG: hypothetical protein IID38_12695 [Planctomycetes bacterium]|nr:hypothetical protein [Planctomycetota bacterium]